MCSGSDPSTLFPAPGFPSDDPHQPAAPLTAELVSVQGYSRGLVVAEKGSYCELVNNGGRSVALIGPLRGFDSSGHEFDLTGLYLSKFSQTFPDRCEIN